jgi:hypothetical protein
LGASNERIQSSIDNRGVFKSFEKISGLSTLLDSAFITAQSIIISVIDTGSLADINNYSK